MSAVVLDASAIIALLEQEPGAEVVAPHVPGALASSVNVAEVVSFIADQNASADIQQRLLGGLRLQVIPFTAMSAHQSGELRHKTRHLGLSLGDRACLALAQALKLPILTADRVWAKLDIGVEIRLIR